MLLSLVLLQPISVLAEETKTISNKVGGHIGSKAQSDAVTAIFDNLEDLNCKSDPDSWSCTQTKQTITIGEVGLGIIGAVVIVGAIYGLHNRL